MEWPPTKKVKKKRKTTKRKTKRNDSRMRSKVKGESVGIPASWNVYQSEKRETFKKKILEETSNRLKKKGGVGG